MIFLFFKADIHMQGFTWQTQNIRCAGKIQYYKS